MANKWHQGTYQVINPEKYIGDKLPYCRSSWEFRFAQFCDENENITRWASESIKIPYQNPYTGKYSNYIPDFLVEYTDANGAKHVELIEIKPSTQTTMEGAGKSVNNQQMVVLNAAKWTAAQEWCKRQGIKFRIVNEEHIFHKPKPRNNKKRKARARVPKRR